MAPRARKKERNSRGWRGYAVCVGGLHLLGALLLMLALHRHPAMLGVGFLAYTLGMRHAFDADHIAAIDNTVRKLVQQGKNPLGVGFYFSLGHSTVVCVMVVVTALAVKWVQQEMPAMQAVGGLIGTAVSGCFLVLIGAINLVVLLGLCKGFWQMRRGRDDHRRMEELLLSRGLVFRWIRPLADMVTRSWHVYPIGFLFGLGFDTASEVALLAISAGAAKSSLGLTGLLALPILFAAGMSLLDTADGVFMTTAYRWAFATPLRKVYYNVTVTGLAVVAALFIGLVELAQVLTPQLGWNDGVWKWLQELDFGAMGSILVVLFVGAWGVSFGAWKVFRIEERWARDAVSVTSGRSEEGI